MLKKVGNCQLWFGGNVGFMFEAFLEGQAQHDSSFEALMNQLWSICEEFLITKGVSRLYALGRDPALNETWFQGHLKRRNYQPVEEGSVVWAKQLAAVDLNMDVLTD